MQRAITEGREAAISFSASVQDQSGKAVTVSWKQMFRSLGLTPEFQAIEVKGAAAY